MKGFKKFLLYVGIFLAVILATVLICFAIMYFSPGTSILGYEYVLYKEKTSEVINIVQSSKKVDAFEIRTGRTDVYVYPNYSSNDLKISHNQGLSGYVHSYNSKLDVTKTVTTKTFEEGTSEVKTLVIEVVEPTGWIAKNNAYICVYIPSSRLFDTCSVVSKSGTVTFLENKKYDEDDNGNKLKDGEGEYITVDKDITFTNLYLKTGDYSDIIVTNHDGLNSNCYFTTDKGDIVLDSTVEKIVRVDENNKEKEYQSKMFSSNVFKYTTNGGGLIFTTIDRYGILMFKDFIIRSYDKNIGPYIKTNYLIVSEKFDVQSYSGKFIIDNILSLSESSLPLVAMTVKKADIEFGEVKAQVSILGEGGSLANNIKIKSLNSDDKTNVFENGEGSVNISNLNGSSSFDSTSGNIKVSNITTNSNIYAYSTSGSLNIGYNFSKQNNRNTKLVVITHTGNINLNNVSCILEVQVLSKSYYSDLNIAFSAVAYKDSGVDNIVNAQNRNVNLLLKGSSDNLQFRILSLGDVNIDGTAYSEIVVADKDYLLNYSRYTDYTRAFRVGYIKDNTTYNEYAFDNWGKLLIPTTGNISVLVNLSATE